MSIVQPSKTLEVANLSSSAKYPWWRAAVLGVLLLVALAFYPFLYKTALPDTTQDIYTFRPFLGLWLISFLPYFAACALVLATRPARGRWRWIELSIILLGAFVLRALLLPLPPGFSRDSWRYLWDARVTLHGFSPYVYSPASLHSLIDNVLYPRMRFRFSPTIYPPGAQAIFLLSYLLAGSNLYVLKGIFLIFDMVTCGALVVYLNRKGLDPRRVLLYAWCPLPIIEFAVNGHVDVISLTFSILALLSFSNSTLRGRILTGFLLGMAALTKIYPILLLVVVVPDMLREAMEVGSETARAGADETRAGASPARTLYDGSDFVRNRVRAGLAPALVPFARFLAIFARFAHPLARFISTLVNTARHIRGRDYTLLGACLLTVLLGYLPYYIMGHGQVLGYFTNYGSEQGENAGIVQLLMQWTGHAFQWSYQATVAREHVVAALFILAVSLVVFVLRLRQRMSMAMAALLLFVAILAISPHVFPWYTTVLLMWVPLLMRPLFKARRFSGSALAVAVVCYVSSISLLQYYYTSGPHHTVPDWTSFYELSYWPTAILLLIAAVVGVKNMLRRRVQSM